MKKRTKTSTNKIGDVIEHEMAVITSAMADVHALTEITKRLEETRPHIEEFVAEFLGHTTAVCAELTKERRAKRGAGRGRR